MVHAAKPFCTFTFLRSNNPLFYFINDVFCCLQVKQKINQAFEALHLPAVFHTEEGEGETDGGDVRPDDPAESSEFSFFPIFFVFLFFF